MEGDTMDTDELRQAFAHMSPRQQDALLSWLKELRRLALAQRLAAATALRNAPSDLQERRN